MWFFGYPEVLSLAISWTIPQKAPSRGSHCVLPVLIKVDGNLGAFPSSAFPLFKLLRSSESHKTFREMFRFKNRKIPEATFGCSPSALPHSSKERIERLQGPGASGNDLSKVIFGTCLSYLINNGVQERNARSLLGKWRKGVGDGEVIKLITEAEKQSVSEPVAWIEAAINRGPGDGDYAAWEDDYYKGVH